MIARTYRLAATDRTGWLLGLGGAQVLPLGTGLAVAVVVVATTGSVMLAVAPFVAGAIIGFVRVGGAPVLDVAPVLLGYLARRRDRRFEAPLVFPGPGLALPRAFGQAEFVVAPFGDGSVAVALDRSAGLAAATLAVAAPTAFLLADDTEQVRFLDNFGDALGATVPRRRPRRLAPLVLVRGADRTASHWPGDRPGGARLPGAPGPSRRGHRTRGAPHPHGGRRAAPFRGY